MSSGSKTNKAILAQQQQAQQQQQQVFDQLQKKSPEQEKWEKDSAAWDEFIKGKNYAKPPDSSILNFDLLNPARINEQRQRMSNLTGIGAAAMGGDDSTALQLSRERNANLAAEDAGASYENAIKSQDAYFKGNALPYAQMEMGKLSGLLNNATGREQFLTNAYIQTRPTSYLPMLLGGALSAGSSLLGAPGLFGGLFNGGGAGGQAPARR